MKNKRRYMIAAVTVCIATLTVLGTFRGTLAWALFDESEAVHIHSSEIEDATLLIGTHMIHISAMNDEIYEIAMDSASESGQQNRYYKSELADGSWFDITDAGSLKAITSEGTPVKDEDIERLFLTHHTKSDGITYDLRTNQSVCIFDISNPYHPEVMKELEALKIPYDMLADKKDKSQSEENNESAVRDFFQTEEAWKDDTTDRLDAQIWALQNYLAAAGEEKRAAALETMGALDAARRKRVLENVRDGLNDLMETLQAGGEELNSDLNSGAGESLKSVEASILAYDAKSLAEGTTILSKEAYAVKTEMAQTAQAGDYAACDAAAEKAVLLKAIMNHQTKDAKKELAYLNEKILPAAIKTYAALLNGGACESYKSAAESGAAKGILNQALKDQMNEAEAVRMELQYLINSALEKMLKTESSRFIGDLASEAEMMKEGILGDAFAAYADSSVETYIRYLSDLLAQRNPSESRKALSRILEQKNKKQEEKQAALDGNDLAGAKKADAELEELNNRIDELESRMSRDGDFLAGEEQDTPQTASQSAGKIAKDAIETIQDGSVDGVDEAIDALAALTGVNPDAALGALKEVYGVLAAKAYLSDKEANDFEECMAKIEGCIADHGQTLNGSLTEEEAKELFVEVAGEELSEAGDQKQAALLQASLDVLEQQANEGILKMAQILAAQMEADKNPYIFRQYNDPIREYIPAKTICICLRYRYIFDNRQQTVTLSKRGGFYTFRAFRADYETADEEGGALQMNAGFQEDVYLWEQDAKRMFQCEARYIPDSDLALLVTEDGKDQASSYLSMLLARLGG